VPATAQGDLGRNALRGFGATQWNMALRRQFRFGPDRRGCFSRIWHSTASPDRPKAQQNSSCRL